MIPAGLIAAQRRPGSGLVKDGTPTDDAVPWSFTAPEAHGAAGNGTTDDTSALDTTFAQSTPVWMSPNDYRTTDTVTVPTSCPAIWSWGGRVLFDQVHDRVALGFGTASSESGFRDYRGIQVIAQSQSNWSSEASVGIKFWNSRNWFLHIARVRGFTLGIEARPETTGGNRAFAYGIGRLGSLENNKIALELDATSTNGWTNENIWFGGRCLVESGVNNTVDRTGIKCHSSTGSYPQANNNNFIGPIFELNASGASGTAISIHFQNLGWGWVNAAYRDADLLFRRDGASHCRWSFVGVGYSPAALSTSDQDAINSGRANENTLADLRRLCNGAAALNVKDIGGAIS